MQAKPRQWPSQASAAGYCEDPPSQGPAGPSQPQSSQGMQFAGHEPYLQAAPSQCHSGLDASGFPEGIASPSPRDSAGEAVQAAVHEESVGLLAGQRTNTWSAHAMALPSQAAASQELISQESAASQLELQSPSPQPWSQCGASEPGEEVGASQHEPWGSQGGQPPSSGGIQPSSFRKRAKISSPRPFHGKSSMVVWPGHTTKQPGAEWWLWRELLGDDLFMLAPDV